MERKKVAISFVLATFFLLPILSAAAYSSPIQVKTIEANILSSTAGFDSSRASTLAENSPGFASYTRGHDFQFNSIFDTWSFDSSGNVRWNAVNVVFSLSANDGQKKNLVVAEDPGLISVTGISVQNVSAQASSTSYSTNWSGYSLTGNAAGSTPVYEAYAAWTIPGVSEPQSYWCFFAHCDLVVWPGLTATSGGSTGIVQAGTDSGLSCSPGCTWYYQGWYEFYPANLVYCLSVNPSDSAAADVVNEASYGGSSTLYDIYVYDFTTGQTCSVTGHSFTSFTTPYYGQFIAERPSFGGSPARLPKFGSVTMSSDMYFNGALQGIYNAYQYGWYIQVIMQNSGNTNIQDGAVQTNSAFTQTWLTSAGT